MGALETILQRHPVWRGGSLAKNVAALPTGFPCLDAELPGGGWPRPGLTELLTDGGGIGGPGLVVAAPAGSWRGGLRLALEPAALELGVHIVKRRGASRAAPLYLPLKRPFHALGRAALPRAADRARAAGRLGLPVHA